MCGRSSTPRRTAVAKAQSELPRARSFDCFSSPTLRRAWPRDGPEAAMCVQGVDVQCVLQFTLIHAAGCALHRRTSRVIHRSKLFFVRSLTPARGVVKKKRGISAAFRMGMVTTLSVGMEGGRIEQISLNLAAAAAVHPSIPTEKKSTSQGGGNGRAAGGAPVGATHREQSSWRRRRYPA